MLLAVVLEVICSTQLVLNESPFSLSSVRIPVSAP